jgi:hypothetical protein
VHCAPRQLAPRRAIGAARRSGSGAPAKPGRPTPPAWRWANGSRDRARPLRHGRSATSRAAGAVSDTSRRRHDRVVLPLSAPSRASARRAAGDPAAAGLFDGASGSRA